MWLIGKKTQRKRARDAGRKRKRWGMVRHREGEKDEGERKEEYGRTGMSKRNREHSPPAGRETDLEEARE